MRQSHRNFTDSASTGLAIFLATFLLWLKIVVSSNMGSHATTTYVRASHRKLWMFVPSCSLNKLGLKPTIVLAQRTRASFSTVESQTDEGLNNSQHSLIKNNRDVNILKEFLANHKKVALLTGAGCSTDSGIPDYRGLNGSYSRGYKPIIHDQFVRSEYQRKRYWARTSLGWEAFAAARPNPTHQALAHLEARGKVNGLITQNVDGLHQKAGSHNVVDLHGRSDKVVCLSCGLKAGRRALQRELSQLNRRWFNMYAAAAGDESLRRSDGDVAVESAFFHDFAVPCCRRCGGVLKPDVTFFGDNVARQVVDKAYGLVNEADSLLVVGTSLMVYSGFRFVKKAQEQNKGILIINIGETRADKECIPHIKLESNSSELLTHAILQKDL